MCRKRRKDQAATEQSIDGEGFLHTGDIGVINERGHLVITDRKKHILVSSGGKNIAPQPIEAVILQSPLIDQLMLIGDGREYCTALIVPDIEAVKAWAKRNNIEHGTLEALVALQELHSAIEKDINRLQHDLAKYERVRRFAVIATPFTVENGMLTPTLKIKRKVVLSAYAQLIDTLY